MAPWDAVGVDVAMVINTSSFKGTTIIDACSNSECVVMATSDWRVFTCDLSDSTKQHKSVEVNFQTSEEDDDQAIDIVSVCCGRNHFLALSIDGRVYSWGRNNYGQLGTPNKKQIHKAQNQEKRPPTPRLIPGLYDVIEIACGDDHSLALTGDGRLFSWGSNGHGQLGIGEGREVRHHNATPTEVEALKGVPVQHIAAGSAHTVIGSKSGTVYVCGSNSHGQLGLQRTEVMIKSVLDRAWKVDDGSFCTLPHANMSKDVKLPVKLKSVHKQVKGISCGDSHTSFLFKNDVSQFEESFEEATLMTAFLTYLSYPILALAGYVQDTLRYIGLSKSLAAQESPKLKDGGELRVYDMGVESHPCEWNKPELSPGIGDKSYSYSSLQSRGRYTFVVDESSHRPFSLNHDEVRLVDGPTKDLQLDPLEESAFVDLFGPNAPPEWPPGCDNIDVKLWKVKKSRGQEGAVELPDKVEETVDNGTGVDGNQGNSQESLQRIFIILHDGNVGKQTQSSIAQRGKIHTLSSELLKSLSDVDDDITMEANRSASFQDAKIVFSSPACLNASFPQTGLNKDDGLNIDLKAVRQGFELISKKEKLLEWISKVVRMDLCRSIQLAPSFDDEDLRFYVILLECPIFHYPQHEWCRRVLAAVGRLIVYKGEYGGDVNLLSRLARWWKNESVSFRKAVVAYRDAAVVIFRNSTVHSLEKEDVMTFFQVLKCLNQINVQHDIISTETFYIPYLRSSVDWDGEMMRRILFLGQHEVDPSWMSTPFLMDLNTKVAVLDLHYKMEQETVTAIEEILMNEHMNRLLSNPFMPFIPFIPPARRLVLVVNRDDIFGLSVQEQLAEMLTDQRSTLQKPLMITFEGERGIDEGALSMEFFRFVFAELLDPEKNDLFLYINEHDPTQSRVWFREEHGTVRTARMFGLLFGLSLYNRAFVPLPTLPQLLYAKLLGKGPKTDMEETEQLDKDMADQMAKLLNGTEDYVKESCYGDEIELNNGQSVRITKANVHLYVEKKVRQFLAPRQFAAFLEGFHNVWDPVILDIFRPIELEALVNGEKHFDWIALEKSTRYIGPYKASHPTITMFWEVFHALDDGVKRKFLVFVAGSDRVPVGGLQNLGLTIDELPVPSDESDDDDGACQDRLSRFCPVAHCCDNNPYNRTLRLPMYTSIEVIEDRLMVALSFYNCPFHIA